MKRAFLALTVALLLLLVAGVGTAAANPPAATGLWAEGQESGGAAEGAAQQEPNGQDSSQSNVASSGASGGNANETEQDAEQGQGPCVAPAVLGPDGKSCHEPYPMPGPRNCESPEVKLDGRTCFEPYPMPSPREECPGTCGPAGDGTQVIGQSADSEQDAAALAATEQEKPSNENVSIRVLSEGDGGDVSQSNEASSNAEAGNLNVTEQTADQTQAGGSGDQIIGQSADNDQDATALAETVQEEPSNTNVSIRVLSPGDDGDVSQSNEASSEATAGNVNLTEQHADQTQAGDSCKCGNAGEQVIGQKADNDQDAAALAETKQEKPSNTNVSIRVLSEGDDGDVWQSNTASSNAEAGNLNLTKQTADQTQAGGSGEQNIGQSAKNDQDATALAKTVQEKPSNTNVSIRVLSPGDSGHVNQSNDASSNASAGNINLTGQHADQTQAGDSCKCGSGLQVIGQKADSEQDAEAIAATIQEKPSNSNTPVRVLSKGDDGDVWQSNTASSNAEAGNLNATKQNGRPGAGRRFGPAGDRPVGQERPGRVRPRSHDPERSRERERARARSEQGRQRRRLAVERGVVERVSRKRQPDGTAR